MSISMSTTFTDLGKVLAAFVNLNGFSGAQAPTNVYTFTVTAANATIAATYTNNGVTFTVLATIAGGTTLLCSATADPTASGTLTKASGAGDATITFSAFTSVDLWGASGPLVKNQGTMVTDILTRLEGAGLTSLIPYNNWQTTMSGIDSTLSSQKTICQQLVQQIILKRVNNDVAQQSPTDLGQAFTELIRQMQSGSASVKSCTVSATTTPGASNTGNATIFASLVDRNGLNLDFSYAESLILRCTVDQFSGATAGSETLSITSPATVSNQTSYLWPGGSGLFGTVTVVDPTQGNGGGNGNLVTGATSGTSTGAFKSWSSSAQPVAWVIDLDGGNISNGTTSNYSGTANCLQFTGNTGGTNAQTSLYQNFANNSITGGSTQSLLPNTVYHFCARVKASVVPAAGVLTFSLTNGSGTVLTNNAGTSNSIVSTISGFGNTNYQTVTGTFQTPSIMPTNGVRLRIKATTPITTGTNVFVDFVALVAPSAQGSGYGGLYAGGPYLSAFRGSTDLAKYVSFTIGDTFTVAIANNNGGSSPTVLSFNPLLNQLCGLAGLGLILPTAGSPSISDSLIR